MRFLRLAFLTAAASMLWAQSLWLEATQTLPAHTAFAEYYDSAKLRSLSNAEELKTIYEGDEVDRLLRTVSSFGFDAADVPELVVAHTDAGGAGDPYGLLSAVPNERALAGELRAHRLIRSSIGKSKLFCQSSETGGVCFTMLNQVTAAYGRFERLKEILDTRDGLQPAVASGPHFADLLSERTTGAHVAGISDGVRLSAWIKDSIKGQGLPPIDWTSLLPEVTAFSYSVVLTNHAHLDLFLDCKSDTAASAFRQILKLALPATNAMRSDRKDASLFQRATVEGSAYRVHIAVDTLLPGGRELVK